MNKLAIKDISFEGLTIDEIVKAQDKRNLIYYITNVEGLQPEELVKSLFGLLNKNSTFNRFSRNKIISIKAAIYESSNGIDSGEVARYVTLTNNIVCKPTTSLEEFMGKANKTLIKHYIGGYTDDGVYPKLEVTVWKMKNYKNKHIKYQ